MNKKWKIFISGMGSILAIYPSTNYAEFMPKGNANDRIRSHWVRAGSHIQSSMNRFADDQKKTS